MGKLNCSIVKDLLPSYCDKMTSKTTNKAVEEHLQTCEKCKKALAEMNKDIETGNLDPKTAQIDYLKGFKKKKKLFAIIACALTAAVLISVFAINVVNKNILLDGYQAVDVNKFGVKYMYTKDNIVYKYVADSTGEPVATGETDTIKTLEVYLYADEYNGMYLTGAASGEVNIFYKILAKELPKGVEFDEPGLKMSFVINDETEHIYLTSANREKREIWNKDIAVPTEAEWQEWYKEAGIAEGENN